MAKLVELKIDGDEHYALVMDGKELAVMAALSGSVGGALDITWRKQSDSAYWALISIADNHEHPSIKQAYDAVIVDMRDSNIEATKEI